MVNNNTIKKLFNNNVYFLLCAEHYVTINGIIIINSKINIYLSCVELTCDIVDRKHGYADTLDTYGMVSGVFNFFFSLG